MGITDAHVVVIREVKHDVCRLSSAVYSIVKLLVFAMNSRRSLFHFCVPYLRIRRKELEIRSYLCRLPLPSAVNVMLNLSNIVEKFSWAIVS